MAEWRNESEGDGLAIKIGLKAEDVGFDGGGGVGKVESGATADIYHRGVLGMVGKDGGGRVDA